MPPIDYSASPSWLQWVIGALAVMALLAGIYGFSRKLWPVLRKFVRTIESLDDLPESLEALKKFRIDTAHSFADQDEKIAEIHHEVHYNNGSSVKDSQARTEKELAQMKRALARVERGVKGLYTREEIDAKNQAISDQIEQTRPSTRKSRSTS